MYPYFDAILLYDRILYYAKTISVNERINIYINNHIYVQDSKLKTIMTVFSFYLSFYMFAVFPIRKE